MYAQSRQSCPTLCNPMDCCPPGSSVCGIFQARTLEWVAMPSSRGSSQPRGQTRVSCITGGFFTAEPPGKIPTIPCLLTNRMFILFKAALNPAKCLIFYTPSHLGEFLWPSSSQWELKCIENFWKFCFLNMGCPFLLDTVFSLLEWLCEAGSRAIDFR